MDRTVIHDDTVRHLAEVLSSFFRHRSDYTVLTEARWQPLDGFPNCVYTFDVMVVPAGSGFDVSEGRITLGSDACPVTVFDVVTRDGYEEDYYDKPDLLLRSAVFEYCLYDPTGEALRPSLQAYRKSDGAFRAIRTCSQGVLFSATGFRLDVTGTSFRIAPCDWVVLEEELFTRRQLLERARSRSVRRSDEVAGLEREIRAIENRLMAKRNRDQG